MINWIDEFHIIIDFVSLKRSIELFFSLGCAKITSRIDIASR